MGYDHSDTGRAHMRAGEVFMCMVYDALGWQGGTIFQVREETMRLKKIEEVFKLAPEISNGIVEAAAKSASGAATLDIRVSRLMDMLEKAGV